MKKLHSVAAISATQTTALTDEHHGGHSKATFLVNVTAITGTWNFAANFVLAGSTETVATKASITATGLVAMSASADYSGVSDAIPGCNSVSYTEAVAGTLTADIYAVYGD